MRPDKQKNVPMPIWILGAVLLGVALFAIHQESKRGEHKAPIETSAPVAPEQVAEVTATAPETPSSVQIQTDEHVAGNTSGHVAKLSGNLGLRFAWSIQGGTLEGDLSAPEVTWKAGNEKQVLLVCRGTDGEGKDFTATTRIPVQVAPEILHFTASNVAMLTGKSSKLNFVTRNAKTLTLNPGGTDVLNLQGEAGVDVNPTTTTTYELVATSPSGITLTKEVTIKVAPTPTILSARAEGRQGSTTFTVTGEFTGGKAELRDGNVVLASSATSPLTTQVTIVKPGTALSFVVTNEVASATSVITFSTNAAQ